MDRDKRGKKRVRAGRRTRGTRGRGYARSLDPRPSTAPVRLGSQPVQGGSNSDNFQQVQGGSNSDTSETDPLTYEVSLTHGSTLPNNASSISVKRAATSSISSDESPMAKKAKPSSPPIYISSGQSSPNALAFGRYKDGPISINSSVDSSTSSPNNVTRDFESPQPGPSNYDRSPQPGPSNYDRSPQPGPSNYDRSPQPGPSNYDRSPQPGLSPTSPILPTLSPLSNISGMSPGYQNSPQPGPSGLHTNRQADDRHNYDTSETSEDSNESFAIEHLLMLINESGYDNSNDGARSRILDEDEVTSSTRPFEFVLPSPKVSHGEATSSTNTDNLTPPDDSTFSFRHLFQSSDEPPVSESKTMRYKYTVMN
ncbi:protein TE42 [Testudinid alphaherpesvirus 3]|uniref:Protein TE42 n=1 Tax=Testudinid alphaherpesvirus 3 TaxID=2560801 RepID=A0A0M3MX74_9ALPH|nr:protein TE42 [Testudinid alphaherpesvirus 3]AKI81698.1 protein TE42 [Testudinid alphaherpesvirus 3]AKI81801.1 protein TE42 [Testudinid alphaherpesvirus 3]